MISEIFTKVCLVFLKIFFKHDKKKTNNNIQLPEAGGDVLIDSGLFIHNLTVWSISLPTLDLFPSIINFT